jgi:hypothetical protein
MLWVAPAPSFIRHGEHVAMTARASDSSDAELELDLFGMVVDPVGDYRSAATPIPYAYWKIDGLLFSLFYYTKQYMSFHCIKLLWATRVFSVSYGSGDTRPWPATTLSR